MIKKLTSVVFLIAVFTSLATAQSGESANKNTSRPDIPGTFVLELGLNRLTERPNEVKYGLWGSRSLNIYYQYDMRIGSSKFSFHPGIGMSMERFKLMNFTRYLPNDTVSSQFATLGYDQNGNTVFIPAVNYVYDSDTLNQINWSGSYRTKKSMMVMNYLEIPIELRFSTRPDDPARSFKIGIGGRVGYLVNSHSKLRYREDGNIKILKNNQHFNINRFRYSAFMKVYFGNFSLFGYYNLVPVFETDKGPQKTSASSYTIGISLSSF